MEGLSYLRREVAVECDLVASMTGVGFARDYRSIIRGLLWSGLWG